MSWTSKEVQAAADGLTQSERAALARHLLSSIQSAEPIESALVLHDLQDAVAKLSWTDRAIFADFLLGSLSPPGDPIPEDDFLEELDRRIEEIESGKEIGIPVDEVIAEMRKLCS